MIDSIQTFGDSFMFGSDLSDAHDITGHVKHSVLTWPALIAGNLKLAYICRAESGRGNQAIAYQVFKRASKNSLNIINWTWIDRFDYNFKPWATSGDPDTIRPTGDELSKFYYKNLHTEIDDKIRSLTIVYSVIKYLETHNFPYIMTYMDHLMVDFIDKRSDLLRNEIIDNLQTFPDDQTFLDWSRANGYPESQGWHPLEQAHEEAAKYWQPIYEKAINTHITTK